MYFFVCKKEFVGEETEFEIKNDGIEIYQGESYEKLCSFYRKT